MGKRKNLSHSKDKLVAGEGSAEPQVPHTQGMEQKLVAMTQGTSVNRDHEPLQDHTWFNSLPTLPIRPQLTASPKLGISKEQGHCGTNPPQQLKGHW